MLIDHEREVYRMFGVERSFWRSWGPSTFITYARLMLRGRRWRGIQGDSTQLGGDFIVGSDGRLLFAYPSRTPSDRPSVERLLAALPGAGDESKEEGQSGAA